jgi:hypothetical protein
MKFILELVKNFITAFEEFFDKMVTLLSVTAAVLAIFLVFLEN